MSDVERGRWRKMERISITATSDSLVSSHQGSRRRALTGTQERTRLSRVLLLEDEPAESGQQHILLALLEESGFAAMHCTTAAEALYQVSQVDFGVVILNLQLPDLHAAALRAELQTMQPYVQVIIKSSLYTDYGSCDSAEEASNLRGFAYVEKGCSPSQLIWHVQQAYRNHLDRYAAGLETTIAERTAALTRTNNKVQQEIAERKQAQEALQLLSHQLLVAQEQERRHIARELHDEIGQSLTALKMDLQKAQQHPLPMAASLQDSLLLVNDILHQVRSLSLTLRPSLLDDLGLVAALRWYIDQQVQRTGIGMQLVTAPLTPRFSTDVETVCFRITQEALTNVARHAQARQVHIELQHEASILQLRIRDDGVGFDVGAARERAMRGTSMGLLGMQERVQLAGGQFAIASNPYRGTEICARFPIQIQRQAYESNSHCAG